jgi:hypothetical protein
MMPDGTITITLMRLDDALYPPSEACLAYMVASGFDPARIAAMGVIVAPENMLQMKAERPDVANILQLLTGPFGIVDGSPTMAPFRVVEFHVGDNVINVEAEYWD